jgi:GntR family transcriptional repressor for pyruvate dehydrogenase complex
MAELVADSLRRQIFEGIHDDGLPKEEELRERFGVAKSSMREALLILETEGLITVRRGNVGGANVHLPTIESAAYSLALGMSAQASTLKNVADALLILEPMCAELCAALEDREARLVPELDALNAAYESEIDDGLAAIKLSRQFHEAVVEGCGNPAFSILTSALSRVWSAHEVAWATEATLSGTFPDLETRKAALKWHVEVASLIRAGDPRVSEAVAAHLREAQTHTLTNRADQRVDVAQLRSRVQTGDF